jgi:hypothetical protein
VAKVFVFSTPVYRTIHAVKAPEYRYRKWRPELVVPMSMTSQNFTSLLIERCRIVGADASTQSSQGS